MTIEAANTPHLAALKAQAPAGVLRSVQAASRRTGVDFAYLLEKAAVESGFDAGARAKTSSASGLYQFIDQTWLEMVRDHGHKYGLGSYADALKQGDVDERTRQQILAYRDDPRVASAMAAEYARANQNRLEATLGREVSGTELYLAHFLGAGGAERFLTTLEAAPSAKGADLLPRAAAANEGVFYENGRARSVREIYENFGSRFAGAAETDTRTANDAAGPQAAPTPPPESPAPQGRGAPSFAFRSPAAPPMPSRHPADPAPLALQAMLISAALDPLKADNEGII